MLENYTIIVCVRFLGRFSEFLRSYFGDYMKLPPEDQRNKHNILGVDFGPYEI